MLPYVRALAPQQLFSARVRILRFDDDALPLRPRVTACIERVL